jgi:hypothetical protein
VSPDYLPSVDPVPPTRLREFYIATGALVPTERVQARPHAVILAPSGEPWPLFRLRPTKGATP